jgi:hypothetical protein
MARVRPDVVQLNGKTLAEVEAAAIRSAFFRLRGSRAQMRKELGISKSALLAKLDRLGLRNQKLYVSHRLTERAIALAFFKHCHAIMREVRISERTLMQWINSRAPFAIQEKTMDPAGLPALIDAIWHMHGAKATHVESIAVRETFNGATAWDGEVQVFELRGHPTAKRAYAWSHAAEGKKRRFYAVLHEGPIDSAVKAVRAAIVADAKKH